MWASIPDALQAMRRGLAVVVVDDEDRENEGDLILPAELATEAQLAFMIRYTSGVICAPLEAARCRALELPPMVGRNEDPKGTAYTVSVDLRNRSATGISAADRAAALRRLADPLAGPRDFTRPGHVFPLRARDGGVLVRAGHTEAAIDLSRLAGFAAAGVLAEVVHDDGRMMRTAALADFAAAHGLPFISIAALIRHRLVTEDLLRPGPVGVAFEFHGTRLHVALRGTAGVVTVRPTEDIVTQHPPEILEEILAALAGQAATRCGCDLHVWQRGAPVRSDVHLLPVLGGLLEAG
jgi:3,4-dihydroxy 2-butanone 4-phosphate synthase / GTP cyclohydrolase II